MGCEPVPHHQHDSTSDLLLADLHRMGVVDANGSGEGYWRVSRANASFVVQKRVTHLLRFAPLIPGSLLYPRVSMTRSSCMPPGLEQREDSPSSPTDTPPMGPASLEVHSR